MSVSARHARASALVASARDLIDERPTGPDAPRWCVARGWRAFLDGLPDDAVDAAEREGLAAVLPRVSGVPGDLAALARAAADAAWLDAPAAEVTAGADGRRASPRKRAQVSSFAALAARVAGGRARIVDVGSGHGHLTRHLAGALDLRAEGWERDPARVDVARALTRDDRARFVAAEASSLARTLRGDDLVVGLHACGELGDVAVRAAGDVGASLALVGCCLQKRTGARAPLATPDGGDPASLTLDRAVLGVGNAGVGDEGVEADLATRTRSRVQRSALWALMGQGGFAVAHGEEMRGVNRRRATGAFDDLVAFAFAQRGFALPPPRERDLALRAAWEDYARVRRWSLPRAMLARAVEVWVALDRAEHLRRRGYEVAVVAAFDAAVSPRNVAVLASRRP